MVKGLSEYYDVDHARVIVSGHCLFSDSSVDGDIAFSHPGLTASGEQAAAATLKFKILHLCSGIYYSALREDQLEGASHSRAHNDGRLL